MIPKQNRKHYTLQILLSNNTKISRVGILTPIIDLFNPIYATAIDNDSN